MKLCTEQNTLQLVVTKQELSTAPSMDRKTIERYKLYLKEKEAARLNGRAAELFEWVVLRSQQLLSRVWNWLVPLAIRDVQSELERFREVVRSTGLVWQLPLSNESIDQTVQSRGVAVALVYLQAEDLSEKLKNFGDMEAIQQLARDYPLHPLSMKSGYYKSHLRLLLEKQSWPLLVLLARNIFDEIVMLDIGQPSIDILERFRIKEAAHQEWQSQICESVGTGGQILDSQQHIREERFHIPIVMDINELHSHKTISRQAADSQN